MHRKIYCLDNRIKFKKRLQTICTIRSFYLLHMERYEFETNSQGLNWLYVFIVSGTCFSMNPHSIVAWMSSNSLLKTGAISGV